MNKDKINELYEKSQEIISMMNILGNFLKLDGIPITPYLIGTYIDNDLSKFMPKTNIEILEKFKSDIEKKLFLELEKSYLVFIQKNC